MASSTESILSFVNVEKTYAGATKPALQKISLDIAPGEFFSILGPSGSGKTTALRLIAGFETADSGQVILAGRNVTHTPPNKREVHTVFQSYALFPHMTVEENVRYPLRMAGMASGEAAKRVSEVLGLVEMSAFAQRYPHQMSGGQRQRIALARALAGRPKVLLLDEPLGALDLNLRQQMQHVLVRLQRELGMTFVYVTHDQGEALSMSNRVAIVSQGVIQQLGSPADIYFRPSNEFVARFIGKANIVDIDITSSGNGSTATLLGHQFPLPESAPAGKAKYSIRYEALEILEPGASGAEHLAMPAVVRDVLFLGNCLEVKVDCAGKELIAVAPARKGASVQLGGNVQIGFRPSEGVVLHG
ncbi:ABC transporter ATP-binding protein [Pseudomonas sp. TCU-HL1]|uniref:ABC transporter ATP-binding protein n=1 Tax=Pseudomonas sp. TCU-HL1 TaxID=1856685 RepID=UPI00083CCC66|nr:ABC transporter ATP-binding protein [Pseudomonas sp. TCU-HL1]AOE85890.1 ABC transporter ATP-binding protein [Pseudomonas sp. TCU-HL1]